MDGHFKIVIWQGENYNNLMANVDNEKTCIGLSICQGIKRVRWENGVQRRGKNGDWTKDRRDVSKVDLVRVVIENNVKGES